MSLRVNPQLLNQSFDYYEFKEEDMWGALSFLEPVTVKQVRIDEAPGTVAIASDVPRVVSQAIAFAYASDTTPFLEFKRRSKVVTKNGEYIINKIVKVNEPSQDKLWSVELELV